MQETQVQPLGWEDPLEEEMATHSSILAWEIPGTEESGRQQSIWSLKSNARLKRLSMHAIVESKFKLFVEFGTIKENCWLN